MSRTEFEQIIRFLERRLAENKQIVETTAKHIAYLGTNHAEDYGFEYARCGAELAKCDGAIHAIELCMSYLADMVDEDEKES